MSKLFKKKLSKLILEQEYIVREHGQSLAEFELENQFEDLNDAEIQEDFIDSRYGYQREAGYLQALHDIQNMI